MSSIQTLNRQIVREIRERMEQPLNDALSNMGLSVQVGSAHFSPSNVTFKVEIAILGRDGKPVDKKVEDFLHLADMYGLKPTDLGRVFHCMGKRYTVSGLAARSYKYPILAKDERGKTYKFPASTVKRALEESSD